jgi:hypothetical protein
MQARHVSGTTRRFARVPFCHKHAARRSAQSCQAAAGSRLDVAAPLLAIEHLQQWLSRQEPGSVAKVEPKVFKSDFGDRVGLCASKDINLNEVRGLHT